MIVMYVSFYILKSYSNILKPDIKLNLYKDKSKHKLPRKSGLFIVWINKKQKTKASTTKWNENNILKTLPWHTCYIFRAHRQQHKFMKP